MAFYYKLEEPLLPLNGIQVYDPQAGDLLNNQSKTYDFSKHVLIELLDDITPETKLWEDLGLASDKSILHKRMMVDSHRVHCRRAVVVCANVHDAKSLVQRVSQTKIMKRCVCATIVQDLLFDFKLFEKQILRLGDRRPQHQLLYVTDLNRCREPAVLAQYLRDLFSPFGTVLSVFVAEDKDGFAHPEGVVKFAHLSEAFAAELAYDQFVVGMERLSVTTHHNILLSQCDLRARLREAQRRYSVTLNNTIPSNDNLFTELDSPESGAMENGLHSSQNVEQKRPAENDLDISKSYHSISDMNISHSTELDDVLKNPCKSNLIDCLRNMELCSESSATKETIDDLSLSSRIKTQSSKSSKAITQPSIVTLPLKEQDWSSRICNWIADIPNNGFLLSNNINTTTDSFDNTIPLGKVSSKPTNGTSSLCSFITCDSGSVNHINSPLSSPSSVKTHDSGSENHINSLLSSPSSVKTHASGSLNDSNRTILRATSSPGSFHTTNENLDGTSVCTSDMSLTRVQSQNSMSQNMSCSRKLSLKNQRVNSSLFSNSQQNFRLSRILNSLNDISKDPKILASPVVRLKRLSCAEIQNLCSSQSSQKDDLRPSKHQCFSSDGDALSAPSVLSDKENNLSVNLISMRRSSRLSSRQSSCSSTSNLSSNNKSQPELAPRSTCPYKSDSPVRAWLKKDLLLASNVNGLKNSRKIVCAIADKNVLAHVGCSNMTCDICYPGSTNLLFGCH